jgi:hypothetical protein
MSKKWHKSLIDHTTIANKDNAERKLAVSFGFSTVVVDQNRLD